MIHRLITHKVEYQMREARSGMVMNPSGVIEVLQSAAMWGALATIVVAFIKARNGRKVMKNKLNLTVIFICILSMNCFAHEQKEESKMSASGNFEIKLEPQKDELAPAGRMIINKIYSGDVIGTGIGQMISKRTTEGAAAYSAIEEFKGSVDGKKGEFTLIHIGYMSVETQSLEVNILEGSGHGELKNIKGKLLITQDSDVHSYELVYEL